MSAAISLRKSTAPAMPIVGEALAAAQDVVEAHWQKHDREPRYAFVDCTPSELIDCIQANQRFLEDLPTIEELREISAACRSYPRASSLSVITESIVTLVGSFPHANMPDPRTYVRMLISDAQALRLPDLVVAHACTVMRRTLQYPPPIASFLEACEQQMHRWHAYGNCAERLIRARERLGRVIGVQQQKLQSMTELGSRLADELEGATL